MCFQLFTIPYKQYDARISGNKHVIFVFICILNKSFQQKLLGFQTCCFATSLLSPKTKQQIKPSKHYHMDSSGFETCDWLSNPFLRGTSSKVTVSFTEQIHMLWWWAPIQNPCIEIFSNLLFEFHLLINLRQIQFCELLFPCLPHKRSFLKNWILAISI